MRIVSKEISNRVRYGNGWSVTLYLFEDGLWDWGPGAPYASDPDYGRFHTKQEAENAADYALD